jgi:penicillin amidase
MDVTDVYAEQFATNAIGLPTHTIYQGEREPLITIYQTYFANQFDGVADNLVQVPVGLDAGGATLVVPRRNNGPIIDIDLENLTGISVQYTGWGATQELVAFDGYARAQDVFEFRDAVQYFDVGSQNWGVADTLGNIAYFTSAENPIREDLQTMMAPDGGVLPIFIRDGTGQLMHEWMPVANPQPQQSLNYEIMPFDEMPQVVNPASGYIVNANNDPIGTTLDNNAFNQIRPAGGLYYLNPGYADYRVGRIDRLMQEAVAAGPVTADHFKAFQANNQLLDAELVMPHFMNAWANAQNPAAWPGIQQFLLDPQMQQVFALWATWDYSTPTGITEGYDPGDNPFGLADPDQAEIDASVAATVWALTRSRSIANTVDGVISAIFQGAGLPVSLPPSGLAYNSLKNLLDNFDSNQGVGASGLPFFNVPQAPDSAAARDFILLFSVREALDLLASDEFAPAFANSADIMDYRWGKLHRIKFDHLLNDVFSLPNGLYGLTTVEGLDGVARSGGYAVLDASSHSARADGLNEFMFGSGPSRRFVGQLFPDPIGPVAEDIIAGGQSGVIGSPLYANQLYLWLVNAQLPQFLDPAVVSAIAEGTQQFVPLQ